MYSTHLFNRYIECWLHGWPLGYGAYRVVGPADQEIGSGSESLQLHNALVYSELLAPILSRSTVFFFIPRIIKGTLCPTMPLLIKVLLRSFLIRVICNHGVRVYFFWTHLTLPSYSLPTSSYLCFLRKS